jgi:2-keto-3-deoxy-L-rhamnonate aldolase RhmA
MNAVELKQAMRSGKVVLGMIQYIPSPTITEIAGLAGFDWVWLCIEHGSASLGSELQNMIRAALAVNAVPVVRVSDNQYYIIMRSLELGAKGVIIPRVQTAEDVKKAVDSTKFPPIGNRGVCGVGRIFRFGLDKCDCSLENDQTLVMILIEDKKAVDNIDEILSVPGVDCAIFGARDLAYSIGIGDQLSAGEEEAVAAISEYRRKVIAAGKRHSIPIGALVPDVEAVQRLIDQGINVIATMPDESWILSVFRKFVLSVKQLRN